MKKQKMLLMLLVGLLYLGINVLPTTAALIEINVSPSLIYSGDTVTINVLPFIGNTEYFAWANMQANAEIGLIDTTNPTTISAVLNGLDNEIISYSEGAGYYNINAINGRGVIFLTDSYGGAWGSDPSTVSGTISFIAGLPGTYHFSTTFHTGDLNMHSSFDWWQPSQLINPPWDELYITVLDGSSSVPVPATILLFGSGLAGLAGARMRKKKK